MNRDKVQLWVDALRSGKYVQGTGGLAIQPDPREPAQFCCLGVACEVAIEDGLNLRKVHKTGPLYFEYGEGGMGGFLPAEVKAWIGADGDSPCVNYGDDMEPLTMLNDVVGLGFNEIADLIEATYLKEYL